MYHARELLVVNGEGKIMLSDLSQTEREVIEAMREMPPVLRMRAWGYIVGLAHSGSAEAAEKARSKTPTNPPQAG